ADRDAACLAARGGDQGGGSRPTSRVGRVNLSLPVEHRARSAGIGRRWGYRSTRSNSLGQGERPGVLRAVSEGPKRGIARSGTGGKGRTGGCLPRPIADARFARGAVRRSGGAGCRVG